MQNRRIYARSCSVEPVDQATATAFLSLHHRQGSVAVATSLVSLGIFREEELVGLAQFCYPRTAGMKRRYTTELLRLAFPSDVRVVGGASKLLAYYRRVYKPADIFTYQDATGELTNVYEACGFTLVSQARRKDYLVAPGKTLETATRKEALGMAYAVRYGPDRILGTRLGEIRREDGRRKSNGDLFVEDLGWHVESTAGDRVYEWIDPDRTYYTYRISASDSDKYYYGVRGLKKAGVSKEECLRDSYTGSGGSRPSGKFKNWKKKHVGKLKKEVLATYSRRAAAYEAERLLIGDLWQNDELCLNSRPGGPAEALHAASSNVGLKDCDIHGLVKHVGASCFKCSASKRETIETCSTHGVTAFRGAYCLRCQAQAVLREDECPIHGVSKFRASSCLRCLALKAFKLARCEEHGEVLHRASHCLPCLARESRSVRECSIHGVTKHLGPTCTRCIASKTVKLDTCHLHGLVPHRGDKCATCSVKGLYSVKVCAIHGAVSHKKDACVACKNSSLVEMKTCPLHGVATHQGNTCLSCSSSSTIAIASCPTHGAVKHRGATCLRCLNSSKDKECDVHGLTPHRGDSCFKCAAPKIEDRTCSRHGLSPHRGTACLACSNEKRVHTRYHKATSSTTCYYCDSASASPLS